MASPSPRQDMWFETELAMVSEHWAWAIEIRTSLGLHPVALECGSPGWSDWTIDWEHPYYFRSETGAKTGIRQRAERRKSGLLEFRIQPKYIGFVPGKDETWIAD